MLSSIQITKQTLFFRKYYQLGRLPIGILLLVLFWSSLVGNGWATYAQSVPKELNLNSYQSPARASEKITLYPGAGTAGVVIPAGLDLDMQIVAPVSGEVPASENAIITTVANQVISVGECASLSATASSTAGNALLFDGVNDFVQVGTVAALKFTTTASFEAWIYPTGAGSHATAGGVILSKEGEYLLARFPNGTIQCAFANTTPGWGWINTGVVAPLNTWSHVAVSYQNGVVKTYLNGTLANTYTGTGVIGDAATTQNDFRIGGRQGTSQYFAGQIDEVKVWSVERSETDIKSGFQQKTDPASANLVGYWSMDNSDLSAQVPNQVTNGAAGTLFNGAARVSSTVSLQATSSAIVWTREGSSTALPMQPDGTIKLCATNDAPAETKLTEGTHRFIVSLANDNTNSKIVETVTITVKGALPAVGLPAETDRNFVVENTVFKEAQTTEASLKTLPVGQIGQKITYVDGLGRSLQSVVVQGAPEIDGKRNDIVSFVEYDPFGRQPKSYLSYTADLVNTANAQLHFRSNPLPEQEAFYSAIKPGEGAAFSETVFDNSPLSKTLARGAVGDAWQIKNRANLDDPINQITRGSQRTNLPGEVRRWTYNFATGVASSVNGSSGFYDPSTSEGLLIVVEGTSESERKVFEYINRDGQTICKRVQEKETQNLASLENLQESVNSGWATTYYIYDDFGLLRYVIPPKATDQLASANYSFDFTAEFTKTWLFAYDYDERHRMIRKRVPGGGLSQMVYNVNDQVVLSQDAHQAEGYKSADGVSQITNEWNFTKYDVLGRVVITGRWIDQAARDRATLQQVVNSQTQLWEERNTTIASSTETGYSAVAFPQPGNNAQNYIPLTIKYYDDYSFKNSSEFVYSKPAPLFDNAPDMNVYGKPTGTRVRMLTTSTGAESTQWLVNVSYFDEYGRVIQSHAQNHQNGVDIASSRYDFSGKMLESFVRHENPAAQDQDRKTLTVRGRTQYDHAGRVLVSYQKIGTGVEEKLAVMVYNQLGEMTQKKLGQYSPAYGNTSSEGNALQTVDYKYNIRGWLKSVNDALLSGDSDDKFGFELSYESAQSGQASGNIVSQKWMSRTDGVQRSYTYSYDPLNRLIQATYASAANANEKYDIPSMSYDKNGNVLSLVRKGMVAGTASKATQWDVVDNLEYSYASGNQLSKVRDGAAQANLGLAGDFKDGVTLDFEYEYDQSGNLTRDRNKGIESIIYNHLNQPVYILLTAGRWIRYVYDAVGIKCQKLTSDGQVTDYMGGLIYEKNRLQFVPTGEGRALPPELAGTAEFAYEYHYKDHQGNLRLAFREAPRIAPFYATMEIERALYEESQFENLSTTRNTNDLTPHTRTGNYSAKLYSTSASHGLGPWKTLYVKKGDKIDAEAFAYYEPAGDNGTQNPLSLYIGNAGATRQAGSETNKNIFSNLQIGIAANGLLTPRGNTVPVGYLQILVYDKNYVLKMSKLRQLSEVAEQGWEELHLSYVAEQDGYVQILIANESVKPVWFDDMKISYSRDLIVQENHYDPWGLNLAGIETQGSPNHEFQFSGKEKEDEFGLNWLDLGARMYDAQLGRFHTIDLLAEKIPTINPYQYTYNNPVMFTDPTGMMSDDEYNDWVAQLQEGDLAALEADLAERGFRNYAKGNRVRFSSKPPVAKVYLYSQVGEDGKVLYGKDILIAISLLAAEIFAKNDLNVEFIYLSPEEADAKMGSRLAKNEAAIEVQNENKGDSDDGHTNLPRFGSNLTISWALAPEWFQNKYGYLRGYKGDDPLILRTDPYQEFGESWVKFQRMPGNTNLDNWYYTAYIVAHEAWHSFRNRAEAATEPINFVYIGEYDPTHNKSYHYYLESLYHLNTYDNLNTDGKKLSHQPDKKPKGNKLDSLERIDQKQKERVLYYFRNNNYQ
ncbi:LamG-like jellyroll fold domain-containing protein [Xanthocytophaga agilis]|uniref:DUF6443 domain-containing protein n=1 Tax=Xanthocytophaga agilis TaxID=3048010 RepID=A0AAE3R7E2_9BACT|nr:LamG-like jellyroll fold domain-containing protein [Xanthocytophaga agilis]MDJ1505196.1 DUF6443 domain-containing protein [Xanthocytophaga agilis]